MEKIKEDWKNYLVNQFEESSKSIVFISLRNPKSARYRLKINKKKGGNSYTLAIQRRDSFYSHIGVLKPTQQCQQFQLFIDSAIESVALKLFKIAIASHFEVADDLAFNLSSHSCIQQDWKEYFVEKFKQNPDRQGVITQVSKVQGEKGGRFKITYNKVKKRYTVLVQCGGKSQGVATTFKTAVILTENQNGEIDWFWGATTDLVIKELFKGAIAHHFGQIL